MSQIFYIEADEEIISVIGRLRKSPAEENIFVFPKRALVLQSIINLRLFQREAQKFGKKIIIVSQDEVGKMLAEKAGMATQNYSENFFRKDSHLELAAEKNVPENVSFPSEINPEMPSADVIGSANFRTPAVNSAFVLDQQKPTKLRVRNASPPKLTSLNSSRTLPESQKETVLQVPAASVKNAFNPNREERLKNFFSGDHSAPAIPTYKKDSIQEAVSVSGSKARNIFFILGAVSLLSLAGVGLFLFLPKAEIYVTPYKVTQINDIELAGRADVSESDDRTVAVRVLEKTEDVAISITTTGKSGGVKQKARGTVVIYNNYSADPQLLVATTRLDTEDGKLFRLVSGITVPGMTNKNGQKEAGAIEVEVIADQTGEEYNIGPTTFRIPGFKGSPKYDGFSAKSTKTMTGGGSGEAGDMAMVAKVDLDMALSQAKEKAKEEFLNEARGELDSDEKILEDQMDIAEISPATLPEIGTIATVFDYKNTFRVRTFVFSEKTVREKIENVSEKSFHNIRLKPVSFTITYSESAPNFSDGSLRLAAHALITMESDINQDALKEMLLGKNKDDMQKVINDFPEVKKIEVTFYPQWFVENIPKNKKRVTIIVKPGEAQE